MRYSILGAALLLAMGIVARSEEKKPSPDPRINSLSPFTIPIGTTAHAIIRGTNLGGARALEMAGEGVEARVVKVEPTDDAKVDAVQLEIRTTAGIQTGERRVRLLTANGITNQLAINFVGESVLSEETVPPAIAVFPTVISGRIGERGEVDSFWIKTMAGQTLTFHAKSGHSSFDPALSILERAPSWLDPNHMERIAFNDEPLFFPGLSTDAHLVYTFRKAGTYCLKLQSANGQGSPDSVYELRISEGASPAEPMHPKQSRANWEERQFTRTLTPQRLEALASRGAAPPPSGALETYRALPVGSKDPIPVMRLPGVVDGRITRPAEAHRIRIKIEKPENIALEVETPEATMPRFNPVILIYEPGGTEVATNVYTKRNNNGLYMMKMIQSKVALPLHAPGEYEMEIRDITTDCAAADFRYRVLVRRQVPHIGKLDISEDHLNLPTGASREVNISIEREEDFNGVVTFAVEGLPQGVTALAAAPKPIDKPPLPNGGKLERYTPIFQNTALVFVASDKASPTEAAAKVRVIARPMVDGKMAEPIVVKELPLMVLPASTT